MPPNMHMPDPAGGRKWRGFRNSDWRGRVDVVSWDAHVYCFVLKQ
jgi:hypothetical protein